MATQAANPDVQLSHLRAQAEVAQLALTKFEDGLAQLGRPSLAPYAAAHALARERVDAQLHDAKIAVARLLLELYRMGLDGPL